MQFISDLPNQLQKETRVLEYLPSIKNTQFCATASGFQPGPKRLIVQQPKDKGVPPPPPPALWGQCVEVWVVMQIANCTGHRGKERTKWQLLCKTRRGRGEMDWCEPPSFLFPFLHFPFHSLYTLNWQLAGKWMRCEVSPLKCRVLLFGQQRSSMRDICCSVIRIHFVTCVAFSPPQSCSIQSVSRWPSFPSTSHSFLM